MVKNSARLEETTNHKLIPFDKDESSISEIDTGDRSWFERTFGPMRAGALRGSIFTIISSSIGAGNINTGFMTLPVAFMHTGIILGPIILMIEAIIAYLGVIYMTRAAEHYKIYNYADLVNQALGSKAKLTLQLIIIVYGFGNLVGYQILVGTFVPSIGGSLGLHADPDIERILIMIILCCGVVFPLALFKNLSAFRFTSLLSAFSVLYVTILVTVQFGFFAPENDYSELNYFKVDLNIFSSFSICLYAYACHINITQIQGELINTSEQRMLKASRRALVTVLVPYMLTGVFGYLSLLNDVPSLIIMRSAPDSINNDWMMVVGRVLMSITLILAIPLNVLPCRKQIQRVILRLEGEPTCTTHVLLTSGLCFISLLIGIFYPNIMVMLNFLGGFCSSAYSIVFPALLGVHMTQKPWSEFKNLIVLIVTAVLTLCGWTSVILSIMG